MLQRPVYVGSLTIHAHPAVHGSIEPYYPGRMVYLVRTGVDNGSGGCFRLVPADQGLGGLREALQDIVELYAR